MAEKKKNVYQIGLDIEVPRNVSAGELESYIENVIARVITADGSNEFVVMNGVYSAENLTDQYYNLTNDCKYEEE